MQISHEVMARIHVMLNSVGYKPNHGIYSFSGESLMYSMEHFFPGYRSPVFFAFFVLMGYKFHGWTID